ncbi:MAG: toprim domain-containing protein [Bacteroidales bacterium]|nr:toprim domain-containing protein [Bacteroidales bacterium]MDD3105092.1 toprim domain-containing protein [Bacteroidales bacterium]MDD3549934.1 toprim domain-containing protein [Bacteroidales bacterium]MDY0182313.1 toprim domain-containing protein [Proteiniphilum sp.]
MMNPKKDIKSILIKDYLQQKGIYPTKIYSGYGLYKSPFRDEETASFKVDYNKNLWHDFGSGEGGSIIDLVMKMQQCNFIQAIEFLEKSINQNVKTYQRPYISTNASISENNSLPITAIQPLENPKLLAFLQSRKIDLGTAKTFCKEIHYQIGGRNYFALGFPNDAGGYELRNPQFKGCLPPKEITTFDRQTQTVHLFEGFMDYLSLLTMQARQADVSAVVLNSINNLEKAVPFLSKHTQINAFLDNDEAGKQAFDKLQKLKLPVVDISKRFADFKDVNDYLCRKKITLNQPKIVTKRSFRR